MAFFDLDEFYEGDKTMIEIIKSLGDNISGLELFWKHFGDSGLKEPDGRLVIERFVNHSTEIFPMNRCVKTICRLKAVKSIDNPHTFDYEYGKVVDSRKRGRSAIDNKNIFFRENLTWHRCCLNHYHTKTQPEYNLKFARGRTFKTCEWHYDFRKYNRNEIYNDSMLKRVKPVKNLIAQFCSS
jgi:hypothetical protein